jgi:hypothetical protein
MRSSPNGFAEAWPSLPHSEWSDTCATMQMWMQIVGKVRLALTPPLNHTWNVTLYPTVHGLTTSPMPCGNRFMQIDFDFLAHSLCIEMNTGEKRTLALQPMCVSAFYGQVKDMLASLGAEVHIWPTPVEVADRVPFEQDNIHCSYDPEYAQRFWRVLLDCTRVFTVFRSRFQGKVSPIHLFWGAMDLACTRFSGRTAPEHKSMPGLPDRITRDAYSHEVSSCGFWPGAPGVETMFYSYAYPEPPGYADFPIGPAAAAYDKNFGEFVLPYEAMRTSADPDRALLEFLQSTYEAAADLAKWDRPALEVDAEQRYPARH